MIITSARFVKGATQWAHLPTDGRPEVAFVGRSNVGKSSLLNMLVGRKALARTSGQPGKTQEFNFYLLNDRLYLVDLPGYGYARTAKTKRAQWAQLIVNYLEQREPLRLVVHLIDSRHPPTALDRDVIDFMRGGRVPYLIALTKVDKLSGNQRTQSVRTVQKVLRAVHLEAPVLLTSAQDRRGRDDLLQWISDVADV
ncbi:MAG: ribosome biogenesis GTP-binding protein YihA/YsxC [Bacteroidota bacterium]